MEKRVKDINNTAGAGQQMISGLGVKWSRAHHAPFGYKEGRIGRKRKKTKKKAIRSPNSCIVFLTSLRRLPWLDIQKTEWLHDLKKKHTQNHKQMNKLLPLWSQQPLLMVLTFLCHLLTLLLHLLLPSF